MTDPNRFSFASAAWIALAVALTFPATTGQSRAQPAFSCQPPSEPRVVSELFFGRNIGEVAGVTEEAWARFVDAEITPRFPDGLTVLDLAGQWRDTASGRIVREPGKLVILVAADEPAVRSRLDQIVEAYKRQFRQQSVLLLQRPACARF